MTISVTGCSTCRRVFISRKYGVPSAVHQELEGAGVAIAGASPERNRHFAHASAQVSGHESRGRRALFHHFLVAALDGALALEQVHDVAVVIGESWISMWRGSRIAFST